jgi:hypothetical protein
MSTTLHTLCRLLMMFIGVLHAAQGAAPCVNYAACIAAYVHNELKVNTMPMNSYMALCTIKL